MHYLQPFSQRLVSAISLPGSFDFVPSFINGSKTTNSYAAVRMALKGNHHLFQAIRCHGVIAGSDIDIFAPGQAYATIPCRVYPFSWRLANVYALIPPGTFLKILPRAVIRIAVNNNEFPICESLLENLLYPLLKKRAGVKVR
ncbi:MAG: hypothetical protein WBW48_00620 [Anaerolineae bacterium]